MKSYRLAIILAGTFATSVIALASAASRGPALVAALEKRAHAAGDAAGGKGIALSFTTVNGWLTRHPELSGGEWLDQTTRARVALAIDRVRGVGGVHWKASRHVPGDPAESGAAPNSLHCQKDVEAILHARSLRFSEASAAIDPASEKLLNEVARALKPCLGSIIAITGHTDGAGDEGANIALSRARADAVRWALIGRGIPADGLRATGKGSSTPLKGLDRSDPANRRIEFSVIETMPLKPTPIDTPGPG